MIDFTFKEESDLYRSYVHISKYKITVNDNNDLNMLLDSYLKENLELLDRLQILREDIERYKQKTRKIFEF